MCRMLRHLRSLLACLSLSAVAGCSPSHPATAPVSGTVIYKGSPVVGATVIFTPEGGGRVATAKTDAEGKFRLSTFGEFDGAMPNSYKVTVTKLADDDAPPKTEEQVHEDFKQQFQTGRPPPAPVVEYLVPEKYSSVESTTLQFAVKQGQNEEARFELTD